MFVQVFFVWLLDLLFVGLFVLALVPLAMYRKAAYAVLKRDFVSYFSTPTGYVFWFLFVLLCSFAAFWPHEFFASNMATLDQLNFWFPIIMLLFIPAITMGIWAEERRQGTDELLLTMPADDLDIVIGKYLAAAAIFTVSLLFSQLANFSVLNYVALGGVDLGLFFTTYLGYWFMGMAMLSIGMVASFLTRNLTVGFVLGVLLNAPLALAHYADVIIPNADVAQAVGAWGMAEQFVDFSRGVISTSSVMYFTMLIALGLYLCMVLIGRRHWSGGRDGQSRLGHYLVRIGALLVITISATVLFTNRDIIRYDATSERISSLSPDTYKLVRSLDFERPVRVEAYISKSLPDAFVRTKYDLKNMLRELQAIGGSNIQVSINESLDPFSDAAKAAEDTYGIRPVLVEYEDRGAFRREPIYIAAAFSSGLERVVVPFFGLGTPIEYELVRSIVTVADVPEEETASNGDDDEGDGADEPEVSELTGETLDDEPETNRHVIGLLGTDAQLNGGMNMQSFRRIPPQPIVNELGKQYQIKDVLPDDEIDKDEIDVLLVVQPSSLTPGQLDNVMDAIRAGIPTAVFEDPFPWQFNGQGAAAVPGTDDPKQNPGGMMGMRQPPPEKCDVTQLWDLLGVHLIKAKRSRVDEGDDALRFNEQKKRTEVKVTWDVFTPVIWQHYNPYLKDPNIPDFAVFANQYAPGATTEEPTFNPNEPMVAGLHEVLFMAPGAFEKAEEPSKEAKGLTFTPLITLGTETGLQDTPDRRTQPPGIRGLKKQANANPPENGQPEEAWMDLKKLAHLKARPELETNERYVMAARVSGKLNSEPKSDEEDDAESDEEDSDDKKEDEDSGVNVVLVSDIDLLSGLFMRLREQPPRGGIQFRFQDVTFVLNLIDDLAGDDRFINIRKRARQHATLQLIEGRIREAEERTEQEIETYEQEQANAANEAAEARQKIEQSLRERRQEAEKKGDQQTVEALDEKLRWQTEQNRRNRTNEEERNTRKLAAKLREIRRDLDMERNSIQTTYKLWAVILPPIPPLLIGLAVWIRRMMRESEGVTDSRRK